MSNSTHTFNEFADYWVLEPVATGYDYVVPEMAQRSVGNFFYNLEFPARLANDLLQLIDLDHDGDLDVVTVEEKGPYWKQGYKGKELGVIWYENPAR